MSFDIAVWRPSLQQITIDEALQFYLALCSQPFQSFISGPEMTAFIDAVVDRFGAAHGTAVLPWAAEPDVADDCAIMPIQSAVAKDMFPIVRDLAREHALVCFDPQNSTVYQPGRLQPGHEPEPCTISNHAANSPPGDRRILTNQPRFGRG